jgi:hypothetical protein
MLVILEGIFKTKVAAVWLTLLLRFRKVVHSSLWMFVSLRKIFCYFTSKMLECYVQIGRNIFLPHSFPFVSCSQPTIRDYTGWFRTLLQYLRLLGRSSKAENVNNFFFHIHHRFRVMTFLRWCHSALLWPFEGDSVLRVMKQHTVAIKLSDSGSGSGNKYDKLPHTFIKVPAQKLWSDDLKLRRVEFLSFAASKKFSWRIVLKRIISVL